MKRQILEVSEDWPIEHLAEFLVENSISGAPVIDENGKLIGVVSLMDIVRQDTLSNKDIQLQRSHEYYLNPLEDQYTQEEYTAFHIKNESLTTVKDIMTPIVFSVNEDTRLQEVADMMLRGRIHRLFVTHNEKVIGIISSLDMLEAIRDM